MKTPTGLIGLIALLATTGCSSPTDQFCIENEKCQGTADPAAACAELKAECEEDAECAESEERCRAEGDAVSACVIAGPSSCKDVGDEQLYLPDDEEACADQLQALIECQES